MDDSTKMIFFQTELLTWYKINGREFLWRKNSVSNYIRIISETLLQRTKAETVNKYLPIFLRKYPSWNQLGNATEIELIEVLKPLGLSNQRGKRLHKLSQELKKRNGVFPKDRSLVEEMPMMGQYITNAYELFILKRPSPLLDVNMARVLERFFGPRKQADIRYDPYLQTLSRRIINLEDPIKINWAILDFASLVCRSKNPKCKECQISIACKFFNDKPN